MRAVAQSKLLNYESYFESFVVVCDQEHCNCFMGCDNNN